MDEENIGAQATTLGHQLNVSDAGAHAPSSPVRYPADLLGGNSQWKLTLPISEGEKVVEVKPPRFATFSHAKYFHLNHEKDGVVFRTYHGGEHTSSSKNPRTELRERFNNDPEGKWAWNSTTNCSMEVDLQVNRLTKVKPHTVVAQIHGGRLDDIVVWRVEGAKLWLTDGNNPNRFLVDGKFELHKRFRLKYELVDGICHFYYGGEKLSYTKRAVDPECYFRAGLYLQSNKKTARGESTSEYSEVVIYSARVTHA